MESKKINLLLASASDYLLLKNLQQKSLLALQALW